MSKSKGRTNWRNVLVGVIAALLVCTGVAQIGSNGELIPGVLQHSSVTNVDSGNTDASNSSVEKDDSSYVAHDWNVNEAPDGYVVRGKAVIDYNVSPGEFHYNGLDSLGRTTYAVASITKSVYDKELGEGREKFGSDADKISGWGHNSKAEIVWSNNQVYKDYGFNRSHLIADSLGGEGKRENLVTGSRFQNVGCDNNGGMAYSENEARKWLSNAGNSDYLYYCATPVYVGDELVPRSVYVDIASSDGTIDQHIEVFNVTGDVKNGVTIDYLTGYLQKDGKNIEKK